MPNLGIIMPRMGRTYPARLSLARALFSHVQLRVLALLVGQPERSFQVSEIIRLAGAGSGAVQRELKKLTAAGILSIVPFGTRKLYQVNRLSPIFGELHGLILKTVGLVEPLRRALQPFSSKIEVAFVYGSIARGTDTAQSDIDLMIIGHDLDYGSIFAALQKTERVLSRPINPNLMTKSEWKRKLADKSSFIVKILEQPKLFVFGTEEELEGIGQPGSRRIAQSGAR
jgi:predicted nucleotidyltransferase